MKARKRREGATEGTVSFLTSSSWRNTERCDNSLRLNDNARVMGGGGGLLEIQSNGYKYGSEGF